MVLFTHNVKKIKGAAHKNGYVDGTCKRGLRNSHSLVEKVSNLEDLWLCMQYLKLNLLYV